MQSADVVELGNTTRRYILGPKGQNPHGHFIDITFDVQRLSNDININVNFAVDMVPPLMLCIFVC